MDAARDLAVQATQSIAVRATRTVITARARGKSIRATTAAKPVGTAPALVLGRRGTVVPNQKIIVLPTLGVVSATPRDDPNCQRHCRR